MKSVKLCTYESVLEDINRRVTEGYKVSLIDDLIVITNNDKSHTSGITLPKLKDIAVKYEDTMTTIVDKIESDITTIKELSRHGKFIFKCKTRYIDDTVNIFSVESKSIYDAIASIMNTLSDQYFADMRAGSDAPTKSYDVKSSIAEFTAHGGGITITYKYLEHFFPRSTFELSVRHSKGGFNMMHGKESDIPEHNFREAEEVYDFSIKGDS